MIEWYADDKLKILFSCKPKVDIRYITPNSTQREIASIKKYPFANKKTLEVIIADGDRTHGFVIPVFNFDGLSIPRFAWTLIGVSKEDNRGLIAALIHDFLCTHRELILYNRALSTNVFNALLIVGGMNPLQRFVMKNCVAFYQTVFCNWGKV